MKYHARIFVDGYESDVKSFKVDEVKSIVECIYEYIQQQKLTLTLNMRDYNTAVALNVGSNFSTLNGKRIELEPFGFHKKLGIQFDYVNDNNDVCYCYDIWCEGSCGTLDCGCIDLCRGRCGSGYDSY
jgi:hypothetical protein